MKQRESLVSNSSSASFIIAYKKGEKCKCCGRSPDGLADKIQTFQDCDRYNYELYARGADDVIKHLQADWFDGDEKNDLTKQINELPEDMEVIYFCVSHHDSDMLEEIESVEKIGGKILYRGEG